MDIQYGSGEQQQAVHEPDLPVKDESGDELLAFHCWRCGVEDYAPRELIRVYAARQLRLVCLPCGKPELYKWRIETLADGSQRRRLYPVPEAEQPKRLGEAGAARKTLTDAICERSYLRDRADTLRRWIADRQTELELVQSRAEQLDAQVIPDLEERVRVAEGDQHADAKQRYVELVAQLDAMKARLKATGFAVEQIAGTTALRIQDQK